MDDTVTVSKKRLEKLINHVYMYGSCGVDCPACDMCDDNYQSCQHTLNEYLKGTEKNECNRE